MFSDRLLLLALNRASFLRPRERGVLARAWHGISDLETAGLEDVRRLLHRDFRDAEMNMDYESEVGSLKYTYVEPEMDETDSYILYEYDSEEALDASYTVSWSEGMTEIQWNLTSKEGRVRDEVKFGDSEWHCWESHTNGLADKVCE